MKTLYFRLSFYQLFMAGYGFGYSEAPVYYELTIMDSLPLAKRFIIAEVHVGKSRWTRKNIYQTMKRAGAKQLMVQSRTEALELMNQIFRTQGALA